MSFPQALYFTLVAEGGYSNQNNDHGGATNCGITQPTYDKYRAGLGQELQPVSEISSSEVMDCYQRLYWTPARCDIMSTALGVCMFDWAVNHGVDGATKTLQEALGVEADGVFGPSTRAALAAQDHDELWREFNSRRREWYQADAAHDPSQQGFEKGWLQRVDRLDAYVETL
ncbi:MAG: glycosyl hydrolase 108 family protein [Gammaproteobacteria bacterium]